MLFLVERVVLFYFPEPETLNSFIKGIKGRLNLSSEIDLLQKFSKNQKNVKKILQKFDYAENKTF